MAITTAIDGSTAFKYTACTDLQELANKSGLTVDQILVFADRQNDALEGGVTPLEIGDVIVLKNQNANNNNNANSTAPKEEPIFTEEKVVGGVMGGTVGVLAGLKIGASCGSIGGPVGAVCGAILGAGIGWIIGDLCS